LSKRLFALADEFRSALERASKAEPYIYITLREFPAGACGDSSLLLAHFFAERGEHGFDYVLGMREDRSHAWLRRSRLIVDITADQFADFEHRVFVGRASPWHREFRGKVLHRAGIDVYGEDVAAQLTSAFRTVSRYL
jgi:hypothetical protein